MLALLDGKFLQIYKFKPKILFNRKHSQYWYFLWFSNKLYFVVYMTLRTFFFSLPVSRYIDSFIFFSYT